MQRIAARLALFILAGALVAAATPSSSAALKPLDQVALIALPAVDTEAARLEDEARENEGLAPRYAIPQEVAISPASHGGWEEIGGGNRIWRLRFQSPGALSLNFGFTRYLMPAGGSLVVRAAGGASALRTFTDADNEAHGELWTPVILADDVVLELTVPIKATEQLELELSSVNIGYRYFGEPPGDRSGACNNDVVCPEGDDWRSEIPAVGVISTGGSLFCTGFMVNNTAENQTPYFMTANHCGITAGNAASLVVYWNFESPGCGDHCCGSLADNQTGSFFRASYSTSDFTLVELDDDPNPAWGVTFAGWNKTSADATSAVGIHHPNTDEKSISFENDPTSTTSYIDENVPGNGSHIRITDWDDGTTENGSSGSPLFDQNHHVVGQLHGGYAACGNDESDWYGRFSVSWTGGGANSNRLSNWLDPVGSGASTLDTLDPWSTGLKVTPTSGLASSGPQGGPFTPSAQAYTLENQGASGFNYSVSAAQTWISLSNPSGYLAPGATVIVNVSINAAANSLPIGPYQDNVQFVNLTTGDGNTSRPVDLQVGEAALIHSVNMDGNPGWSAQGQWAWGDPTGQGGSAHGLPDPNNGFDGTYVYGYNLSGDYTNNMAETHLTSTPFDCSALQATKLKFRRWLNVEQPDYDHAYVRISTDNVNWTQLWTNGSEITDSSWQLLEFDISAIADGQSAVYLRWTMGTTDSSWLYSGWNIDNVEIWGISGGGTGVADGAWAPARTALLANVPNPFNPRTEIRYELARAGAVSLAIYDVAGRRLATLVDADQPSGPHAVTWDGRNEAGASSSGIYFVRLMTADGVQSRKITLLK